MQYPLRLQASPGEQSAPQHCRPSIPQACAASGEAMIPERSLGVTRSSGIEPQPWGSSALFFDYDGDQRLDLYVGNYLKFGPNSRQLCDSHGIPTSCPPRMYPAEKGVLYRNAGGFRFQDVTASNGVWPISM